MESWGRLGSLMTGSLMSGVPDQGRSNDAVFRYSVDFVAVVADDFRIRMQLLSGC
jgi:hypothetical protein